MKHHRRYSVCQPTGEWHRNSSPNGGCQSVERQTRFSLARLSLPPRELHSHEKRFLFGFHSDHQETYFFAWRVSAPGQIQMIQDIPAESSIFWSLKHVRNRITVPQESANISWTYFVTLSMAICCRLCFVSFDMLSQWFPCRWLPRVTCINRHEAKISFRNVEKSWQ